MRRPSLPNKICMSGVSRSKPTTGIPEAVVVAMTVVVAIK
jgi:hypothetical protein